MTARRYLSLSACFFLLAGCTARAPVGAQCVYASDCVSPLVCLASQCRSPCQTDRDCNGLRCLNGMVCELPLADGAAPEPAAEASVDVVEAAVDAPNGMDAAADVAMDAPAEAEAGCPLGSPGCPTVAGLHLGARHSCALLSDGTVWCWGANDRGQLGNGTTTQSAVPVRVFPLAGGMGARILRVSGNRTCAIEGPGTGFVSGRLWCWGENGSSQSGPGSAGATLLVPTLVPVPALVREVALSPTHTCVQEPPTTTFDGGCALAPDYGTVRCFGANNAGQVGAGGAVLEPSSAVPSALGDGGVDHGFDQVYAGEGWTCRRRPTGPASRVYECQGQNAMGQLGAGDRAPHATPVTLSFASTAVPSSVVSSATGVGTCVRLDAVPDAGCLVSVTAQSTSHCWGPAGTQRLPFLGAMDLLSPTAQGALDGVNQLGFGESHGCGATASTMGAPSVRCWGSGALGQLGSIGASASAPQVWSDLAGLSGFVVSSLSVGGNHNCVQLQARPDGGGAVSGAAIYCWGDNSSGQLGAVTPGPTSATPVRVLPGG